MLRHPPYWLLLVLLWKAGERRLVVVARADASGRQRGKPSAQHPASLTSA